MSITSQSFAGVLVEIRARQPKENEEVDFAMLTTGRLKIDENLEITLHSDLPQSPVKLGMLSRASAVPDDDSGCRLDVEVAATKHGASGPYRLTFRSAKDTRIVARLADQAMMEESSRRDSSTAAREAEQKQLLTDVVKLLSERRPLCFEGVLLLGPDPAVDADDSDDADDSGSEVLLGEGVVVLLDGKWQGDTEERVAAKNVGKYELRFYGQENGAYSPVMQFDIAPNMALRVQHRARAEMDDEEEAALTFTLAVRGKVYTFAFESLKVGHHFERDFDVRSRLMSTALLTATSTQEVVKLQKSPLRVRAERCLQVAMALPALALLLASQSQTVASGLCYFLRG